MAVKLSMIHPDVKVEWMCKPQFTFKAITFNRATDFISFRKSCVK